MHYVYVLQSIQDDEKFYIGFSNDLRQRLAYHNAGKNPSTKGYTWHVVYYEAFLTETAARKRERVLKHDGRSRYALMERIKESLDE